ncbi:MAG: pentapeptide repeat-containing protein [Pseudomonadota bacterium]
MTPEVLRDQLSEPWHHGEHHDLRGIVCEGPVDLSGKRIAGFDLSGARFPHGFVARGTVFEGLSWFGGVRFQGPVDFTGATFTNDARFEACVFEGAVRFASADFRGIARFDGAHFHQDADFSSVVSYGNFSLQAVQARGRFSCAGCEWLGGLWCQDVRLSDAADLSDTQVHGRLWLRNAMHGNRLLGANQFSMTFGYSYS